jgi:mannitol/fructose-specific phosphotransferase system IIA component (Ntr-type)
MACRITDYMRTDLIAPSLKAVDKSSVLFELAELVCTALPQIDLHELHKKLLEREHKASTGADHGIAIPHASVQGTDSLVVAVGRSTSGISFAALDNQDSKLFFLVVAPANPKADQVSYLQLISAICRLMRSAPARERLLRASTATDIFHILENEEISKFALPPPTSAQP